MCSKAGQMRWASAITPSAAVTGSTRATARISDLADFSRSIYSVFVQDDWQMTDAGYHDIVSRAGGLFVENSGHTSLIEKLT